MSYMHSLVILSAAISIAGFSAYARDTFKGVSQLNKVSWGLWALAPLIGTFAALSSGADVWATSRIFLAGFLPLIIFIISFRNEKNYWKLGAYDYVCGAFSFAALVAWVIVGLPTYAIVLAASADAFASLPTIRKSWLYPETETKITYVASLVSVILIFPTVPIWNIENSAFLLQLFVQNIILVFAVYRKSLFKIGTLTSLIA